MPRSNLILSLAEWEYAHKYRDFLTVGDPEPDSSGFDYERIREITKVIGAEFYSRLNAAFGDIRNRVHGR